MFPHNREWLIHERWLTHEMFLINQAVKQNEKSKNKHREDGKIMIKFLTLLAFVAAPYLMADYDPWDNTCARCPHCEKEIELKVKPGNWTCPKCGYQNMNEIRYCPLCGSERQ